MPWTSARDRSIQSQVRQNGLDQRSTTKSKSTRATPASNTCMMRTWPTARNSSRIPDSRMKSHAHSSNPTRRADSRSAARGGSVATALSRRTPNASWTSQQAEGTTGIPAARGRGGAPGPARGEAEMGGLNESRAADRVRPRRRIDGGHGWARYSMSFPTNRPWRRCAVATAILATVLGMPTPARAVVACSFSGATFQFTLGAAEDEATVVRDGLDIVVRDATSVIPCGNPTVDTVDTIRATDASIGTTEFTIDLSGGMFELGLTTPEGDGTDEIEFAVDLGGGFPDRLTIVGTGGPDDFLFRSDGIVLNTAQPLDADVEVTASGVEDFAAEGAGGADVLSGEATFPARLVLDGQGGADTITGGTAGDELAGGDGDDQVFGGNGADDLFGGLGIG